MQINTNLFAQATPAILLLSFGELLLMSHDMRKKEDKRNILNSVIIGVVFLVLTFPLKTVPFIIFSWIHQYRLFDFEQTTWLALILCLIANDVSGYWIHRLQHVSRFFWASHRVHHSSETYSYLSAVRESWVGFYTGAFLIWSWIPLVGFSPELLLYVKSISALYQYALHTEMIGKLPKWFEFVFNTPSHHRVHHSSEVKDLDMNCGNILIIWDKIFGTFREEPETRIHQYGLTTKIPNPNPVNINFSEFGGIIKDLKRSPSLRHKFMYIFGPPGWSHDGRTKTAKQLRDELAFHSTPESEITSASSGVTILEFRPAIPHPSEFSREKLI
ncbi:MAG TPA: sterol desaturase family protein [Chitinophagaceae bacterium]|nr:sterol desaturase family protein [Chitinophagaceae bacterium]